MILYKDKNNAKCKMMMNFIPISIWSHFNPIRILFQPRFNPARFGQTEVAKSQRCLKLWMLFCINTTGKFNLSLSNFAKSNTKLQVTLSYVSENQHAALMHTKFRLMRKKHIFILLIWNFYSSAIFLKFPNLVIIIRYFNSYIGRRSIRIFSRVFINNS